MNNEEIQACMQPSQNRYIKIEILDSNDYVVDEISGLASEGNLNIDGNSSIRRTCDLKFVLTSKLVLSSTSPLWINKRFRLWVGILYLFTGDIIWYDQGVYIINDPIIDIQINSNTISIKGLDKMAMIDNTLSGELKVKTVIPVGTPISDAIKSTAQLSGETKLLIDTSPYTIPYKIEKEAGNSIYDVLKEIQDLYMTWKCFYDVNGNFVFRQIKNHLSDPIVFDFSQYNVIQSISQTVKYSNVKNYIKVIGKLLDTGAQYTSELYVHDAQYPFNPFTIEKMGEQSTRNLIISGDKYYTQQQVDDRRDYEFLVHSNFADTISISCIPLLFLDTDQIIYINMPEYNIEGKYCITSISCGLKHSDLMQISAYKLYM
jgi:hypothetical protein